MGNPYRVLFVCLGNICRSPAAHGVFEKMVADAGLASRIEVDSAGTGGWHAGDGADPRMRRQAAKRGYELTHRARQVKPADFDEFDVLYVMDDQNYRDLRGFAPLAKSMEKVKFLADFATLQKASHVPDPYYGELADFDEVLDLVEDACRGVLAHWQASR
jgi:protein-tyrosine phosphatase